jgi:hypothetical protein
MRMSPTLSPEGSLLRVSVAGPVGGPLMLTTLDADATFVVSGISSA